MADGSAALTLFATGWGHVKSLSQQFVGRVAVKMTVSGYQADEVLLYLKHHPDEFIVGATEYFNQQVSVYESTGGRPTGQDPLKARPDRSHCIDGLSRCFRAKKTR